jgi:hypothetical protein
VFVDATPLKGFVARGLIFGSLFLVLALVLVGGFIGGVQRQGGWDAHNVYGGGVLLFVLSFVFFRFWLTAHTARLVLASIESTDSGFVATVCSGKRISFHSRDLQAATIRNALVRRLKTTPLARTSLKVITLPSGTIVAAEEWLPRIFEMAGVARHAQSRGNRSR